MPRSGAPEQQSTRTEPYLPPSREQDNWIGQAYVALRSVEHLTDGSGVQIPGECRLIAEIGARQATLEQAPDSTGFDDHPLQAALKRRPYMLGAGGLDFAPHAQVRIPSRQHKSDD